MICMLHSFSPAFMDTSVQNEATKRDSGGAPRYRFRKTPRKAFLTHTVESWFKVKSEKYSSARCKMHSSILLPCELPVSSRTLRQDEYLLLHRCEREHLL